MNHREFENQIADFARERAKNNFSKVEIDRDVRFLLSDKVSDKELKYARWWWDENFDYKLHIEVIYPDIEGKTTIICPFYHLQRHKNELYANYDRAMGIIQ